MSNINIQKMSGTSRLWNRPTSAGIVYDTDDDLVKINGSGTVQGLGFNLRAGSVYCVDGSNGSDNGHGKSWAMPKATIQGAMDACSPLDTIFVRPKLVVHPAADPVSYAETVIIPATHFGLKLIGIGHGPTQGGLPQVKIGAGAVPLLTMRAPGCLVQAIGFNGAGATGGGILLDSESAPYPPTKDAFGAVIRGCHFKNCQGSGNASTGGAIYWPTAGGSWQTRIEGNRFYQNRASIVVVGTGGAALQDIAIVGNEFLASVKTNVDADIYIPASGCSSLNILDNAFMCPDVPAYASSPAAARYVWLVECIGGFARNYFACTGKTFGDGTVNAGKIPATMYMIANYQEDAIITRTS